VKYFFLVLITFAFNLQAYEFGNIATASKTGKYYELAVDMQSLLKKYDINITPVLTSGSYENLAILDGKSIALQDTFFAIVQKDAIAYYSYLRYKETQKSVFKTLPAILSLGTEQIHVLVKEDSDIDFDVPTAYNVYCGDESGGACVTAQYIQEAYNLQFNYINANKEEVLNAIRNGTIDIEIRVQEAPIGDLFEVQGIELLDMPTNFVMEEMYLSEEVTKTQYPWLIEDMHIYAVPRVLITNLDEEKYEPVIESFVKIMLLNKEYLASKEHGFWTDIDFTYMDYKKFSKASRRVIQSINK
jgi:TRAP-type uncharacterized transport system substrate-binding protein